MKLRNILKLVVLLGVIIPLSKGISVPVNQAQAFPFLLLFLLVSILEHYLFNINEIPSTSNFSIDLGVVRSLADAEPNLLPVRVNSLIIAKGEIPDWIVVAGGAPSGFPIAFTSFQLVYNDKTVIIECPFNKALYDKFCAYKLLGIKGEYFNEDNYDIMQRAMLEAGYIVATHEHWDHVGGIAQSPHVNELLKKTLLTKEQVEGHTIKKADFPPNSFSGYNPLEYDKYHVLSPGIVLIKAPGHSLGSQMVFVRLQDGKEFLFIGDVGWNMVNIEKLTNHSRMGMLLRYEDGRQLGHQLRWMYDNVYNDPSEGIHLLTSHDFDQIQGYIQDGIIGETFD